MNYLNIYRQLIKKRIKQPSTQQYVQRHHIIPRSIDPSKTNDKNNIVLLSAREHYIAHALLVKITQKSKDKSKYYKMIYAFKCMNIKSYANEYRYINSHLYQLMKYKYSEVRKQLIKTYNPTKNKIWICNLELNQYKLIEKNQSLENNWLYGRPSKGYILKYNSIMKGQNLFQFINYQYDLQNKILPKIKKKNKQKNKKKWIYNILTLEFKMLNVNDQLPEGWAYGMGPKFKEKIKKRNINKDKIWITNVQTYEIKSLSREEIIPTGWIYGRISKPDLSIKDYQNYTYKKFDRKQWKLMSKQQKTNLIKQYYIFFKKYGLTKFCQKYKWNINNSHIYRLFKQYV